MTQAARWRARTGSGIRCSTAAFSATSAPTRSTSSSTTPARPQAEVAGIADRQCEPPAAPQVPGFRRHDAARQSRRSAMCAWTGSRPTASAHGAMAVSSSSARDGYIEVRKYTDVAVGEAGQQSVHRGPEAGPLHRLQQCPAAVRAAVRRRRRESHPYRAGPGPNACWPRNW